MAGEDGGLSTWVRIRETGLSMQVDFICIPGLAGWSQLDKHVFSTCSAPSTALVRDTKIQRAGNFLARTYTAYPALVVFAPEAGCQRPGEDRPFATSVPWNAPPMRVPRKESTLQVGLAGLGDLLDEGAREREHRWLQKSWLSTWVGMWIPGGAGWVRGV